MGLWDDAIPQQAERKEGLQTGGLQSSGLESGGLETGRLDPSKAERKAVDEAVKGKRVEIQQARETRSAKRTRKKLDRTHGEFPVTAHPGGAVRLERKDEFYPVTVTGCQNGAPAAGLAAYFRPPSDVVL